MRPVGLLALLAAVLLGARSGAKSGDVEMGSYTLLVDGYQETITVNTTPEEIFKFLSRPNELTFRDVEFRAVVPAEGREEFGPGTMYHFMYKQVVRIPGRMIALKYEPDRVWIIRDYLARNLQQWSIVATPNGTQVTLRQNSEISDAWWVDALIWLAPPKYWYKSVDGMLAQIQANYDPALDPRDLLRHGLRGEGFQSVLQVHTASVWIDSPPERLIDYLDHPPAQYLPFGVSADGCLNQPLLPDRVRVCTSTLDQLGREIELRTLGITWGKHKITYRRRLFQETLDLVGFLEMQLKPKGRGTRLLLKWAWDLPDPLSPDSLEQAIFIQTVPEKLEALAREVKRGAEAAAATPAAAGEGVRP